MSDGLRQFLALDVGEKRIGVAGANSIARISSPVATLQNDDTFIVLLQKLIHERDISVLVIGLPRGLNGQETSQTQYVRDFAARLQFGGVQLHFQDEALTSVQAEAFLKRRGKPYTKEDIDAAAACLILDDFLAAQAAREV